MGVKPPTIEEHLEIEAIKKLRVLYSQFFDSHRTDEMAMLFTEDAVCEFSDDLPMATGSDVRRSGSSTARWRAGARSRFRSCTPRRTAGLN